MAKRIQDLTMDELKAKIEEENKKWEAKQLAENARMKAQGFTHLFEAWIHPKNGGDDYQMGVFIKGMPDSKMIAKYLRKSEVKTDYKITVL